MCVWLEIVPTRAVYGGGYDNASGIVRYDVEEGDEHA